MAMAVQCFYLLCAVCVQYDIMLNLYSVLVYISFFCYIVDTRYAVSVCLSS